jgi:CPA1 family monovalent cation:H+ antiporter
VLAVVAAGLVNGNLGSRGMSPTTRIVLFNFWEYVAFLANSLVFLLIGLQVDIPALLNAWQPILWAIGGVVAARILVVYALGWIGNRLGEPISLRWKHVLSWGGLRGALSLALALSLPAAIGPDRSLLLTMAFGVVLFTLLVQATTMRTLVRRLGITIRSQAQIEYEIRHAELTASRAAESHLEHRFREGLISAHAWEVLRPRLQEQNAQLAKAVRSALKAEPSLEAEELEVARREIFRAKRSAFLGLRRDGVISEEAFTRLSAQIDAVLEEERDLLLHFPEEITQQQEGTERGNMLELRELVIEPGSASEGHKVRHVSWPADFVIASLRRGSQTFVPRGDTVIQAGDILVTMASKNAFELARALCQTVNGSTD